MGVLQSFGGFPIVRRWPADVYLSSDLYPSKLQLFSRDSHNELISSDTTPPPSRETALQARKQGKKNCAVWEASREVLLPRGCWPPRPPATSFRPRRGLWRRHRLRGRWESGKAPLADALPRPPACRQCLRPLTQQRQHKPDRLVSGEKQNVAGYLVYFVLILVVPEMRRPSTLPSV